MLLLYIKDKICTTTAGNTWTKPAYYTKSLIFAFRTKVDWEVIDLDLPPGQRYNDLGSKFSKEVSSPCCTCKPCEFQVMWYKFWFYHYTKLYTMSCMLQYRNSFMCAVFSPLMIVPQGIKIHVAGVWIHIWCLILHRYLPLSNAQNVSWTPYPTGEKHYHINLCWSNPYSAYMYSPTQ